MTTSFYTKLLQTQNSLMQYQTLIGKIFNFIFTLQMLIGYPARVNWILKYFDKET